MTIYLYPADELIAADIGVSSPELRAQRIETINFLCKGQKGIVIVPIAGLRKIMPPKELWVKYFVHWHTDDEIDLDETIHSFIQYGLCSF